MVSLFNDVPIADSFRKVLNGIDKRVLNQRTKPLNPDSIDDLTEEISAAYALKGITINMTNIKPDIVMKAIPGSMFPSDRAVEMNKKYDCAYVNFTAEVQGDITLLSVRPKTRVISLTVPITVNGNTFSFGKQTFSLTRELSDAVKTEVKAAFKLIKDQIPSLQDAINEEVKEFNLTLYTYVKAKLLKKFGDDDNDQDMLNDLTNV